MRIIYIIIIVILFNSAYSQEMPVDWSVCFGADYYGARPEGVAILPNGNTVLSTRARADNPAYTNYHGGTDAWVLILDSNGSIVRERCFGGSNDDYFIDNEVGDGFIYFAGYTNSTDGDALSEPIGNPLGDLWIVKTDFDLNIIWEKKYGPLGPCWLASSDLTDDDGLVVITDFFGQVGGNASQYYGGTDIWAFEIDENSNILWEKTLGNPFENTAGNILSTDHGTTMILGETSHSGAMVDCECHSTDGITRDIWLVELNNQGEIIWQDCYGGSNWELGKDIQQEDNGYTMFIITESNDYDVSGNHSFDQSDYWLAHIDASGVLEWQNCYGGSEDEIADQFYKTANNGYVLIGSSDSDDGDVSHHYGNFGLDIWVVVLDSNRNILWEHSYGSLGHNYPSRNSIAQRGEMDFVIASNAEKDEPGTNDIICTPYPVINDEGIVWVFRIYDPDVGTNNLIGNYASLSIYPNPAKDYIVFELPPNTKKSELYITNIYGKTISNLPIANHQAQVLWDCRNAAAGVYFYQTELDGPDGYREVYRGKFIIHK